MPILKEIKKDIAKILNTNDFELIVFGSYARGEAREDSDLDLLLVTKERIDLKKEIELIEKIFNKYLKNKVVVQILIKDENSYISSSLYNNLKREGVKIWKLT